METIYLSPNEYKALKFHWAGTNYDPKHKGNKSKIIANKCKITVDRYNEIVELSQKPDIIIKERV